MNQEVLNKINNILSLQFGQNQADILENHYLVEDLGADSLDIIELVMELESQFNIKLEEEEYESANTVSLIINLVEKKLNHSSQRSS